MNRICCEFKVNKENIKFFSRNGRCLKYREIISMNYTLDYRILLG